MLFRGVNGQWAGWAIAHPDFGRIEGAAVQRQRVALLLAHSALDSYLRPCNYYQVQIGDRSQQQKLQSYEAAICLTCVTRGEGGIFFFNNW